MMLLVSLILGVAVFFMLETFSNFQEFDLIDATVLHYKNITGPIPERPQGTLTYSIQKRVSEIYGYKGPGSGYNAYEMTLQGQSAAKEFYRRYLNGYVNKISKVCILSQTHPTTKFFTINNERIFQSAKSYIDVFVLDDQKLYGLPQAEPTEMEWRTCFSHQVNGSAEAVAYNEDKNTLVSVINHHTKKGRTIRVYNELSCDYRDAIDSTTHMEHFCSENEKYAHKSHICEGFDLKSVTPKVPYDTVKTPVSYVDIRVSSDSKIANIAAGNDIIAYTTIGEHMKIHYTYKHEEHGWAHQTIDYSTREKLRSFKYHQNLGLMFIGSTSNNEQQLLVVDAIANDVRLDLIYFSYTFVGGKVLEDEDAKVLGNYTLEVEEEFDLNGIYHSEMQELFKLEVSEELNSIDPLNSMSLPNSILKYNSKTKQILVVSLERYILLICPQGDEGNFYGFVLSDFEDQAFKIKSVDISPTGIYFAFLVNYKNSTKAFILKNEYIYNVAINKLFLVNFDYSLNSGKKQILDLRLIKNVENDMILMVLLESGEIASYGLRTGATKVKGSLIDILIEEDMDYLYMLLLFTAVCALVTVKFARSIRINVNIRRRVAPQ